MTMRKRLVLAIALLLGGSAVVQAQDAPRIVMVSPNPLGVNDYLKLGAAGTQQAAAAHGGTAKIFESVDPITRKRDLEAAAKDGASIVVSLGFEFTDLVTEVAKAYPKTSFIAVDYCPAEQPDNLYCVFFREHEMSFLAGAEAAWLKPSGTFGAIGGVDIPLIHRYTDGFLDGVKYASPDAQTRTVQFVGGANPFSDPARASQVASAMFFDNVDTILVAAGASGGGVINAAQGMPGKTVVGADANQCPTAPGSVIDNVEKRPDRGIVFAVDALLSGHLERQISLGLKEGAVTLSTFEGTADETQCLGSKNADVLARVKALRQDIIDGKVKVKDPMGQ